MAHSRPVRNPGLSIACERWISAGSGGGQDFTLEVVENEGYSDSVTAGTALASSSELLAMAARGFRLSFRTDVPTNRLKSAKRTFI